MAAAVGAAFVRGNIAVGAVVADQGVIQGDAYGTLRYRLSDGDADDPSVPDLWSTVVRRPLPHPQPVTWRIESYDAVGTLVGVSADRRMVVFNRIFAP